MTGQEVSQHYHIPPWILKEYESWRLCGGVEKAMEDWHYSDQDIDRLNMIMTLHDIGFEINEVETYMKLVMVGKSTKYKRIQMLSELRDKVLNEIHYLETQLAKIDYLRNEIRNIK